MSSFYFQCRATGSEHANARSDGKRSQHQFFESQRWHGRNFLPTSHTPGRLFFKRAKLPIRNISLELIGENLQSDILENIIRRLCLPVFADKIQNLTINPSTFLVGHGRAGRCLTGRFVRGDASNGFKKLVQFHGLGKNQVWIIGHPRLILGRDHGCHKKNRDMFCAHVVF